MLDRQTDRYTNWRAVDPVESKQRCTYGRMLLKCSCGFVAAIIGAVVVVEEGEGALNCGDIELDVQRLFLHQVIIKLHNSCVRAIDCFYLLEGIYWGTQEFRK